MGAVGDLRKGVQLEILEKECSWRILERGCSWKS